MEIKIYYTADKLDSLQYEYVMNYDIVDNENIRRIANHIINRISERIDVGRVTRVLLETNRMSICFKEGLIPFIATGEIVTAINFLTK